MDKNRRTEPTSSLDRGLGVSPDLEAASTRQLTPAVQPFAGRIGGNQEYVLNPNNPQNAEILKRLPDAAPHVPWRQSLDLRGLLDFRLWKFAIVETFGTMMLVFVTAWISAHPSSSPNLAESTANVFGTPTFLGPLIGGITNWILLMLFIYTFSAVSGAHLNPTITIAAFFARLITLPRLILYVAGQVLGATLAGFALRSAYGSTDFQVGGCTVDTSIVPVSEAFVLEFMFTLTLIFLAFGVGLDPRQGSILGAILAPWLVGLVLGVLSFGSSFTRAGYSGASMNPARCLGVFVGSGFATYHWIHWVAPIAASIGHGIVYFILPPWTS